MGANIELTPVTAHGHALLDELESRTQQFPYLTRTRSGARTYHLGAEEVGMDWFDPMLDLMDPAWREHLTR
jgi:hypothetical protein